MPNPILDTLPIPASVLIVIAVLVLCCGCLGCYGCYLGCAPGPKRRGLGIVPTAHPADVVGAPDLEEGPVGPLVLELLALDKGRTSSHTPRTGTPKSDRPEWPVRKGTASSEDFLRDGPTAAANTTTSSAAAATTLPPSPHGLYGREVEGRESEEQTRDSDGAALRETLRLHQVHFPLTPTR